MDDRQDSMEFLVTAADLRLAHEEVVAMLERLARMFELALPDQTEVQRGGWFFSKEKPVEQLRVKFPDTCYALVREGRNHVRASVQKSVRGVVLKTQDIDVDAWTAQLAEELNRVAAHNTGARAALDKLTRG